MQIREIRSVRGNAREPRFSDSARTRHVGEMRHAVKNENVIAFHEPGIDLAFAVRVNAARVIPFNLHVRPRVGRETGDGHRIDHVAIGIDSLRGALRADVLGGCRDGSAREHDLFAADVGLIGGPVPDRLRPRPANRCHRAGGYADFREAVFPAAADARAVRAACRLDDAARNRDLARVLAIVAADAGGVRAALGDKHRAVVEVGDHDPFVQGGDVQSGVPRRVRCVEDVRADEAQRVRAVENRYRRTARRLEVQVRDRERECLRRIDGYVDLAIRVRAGYHAGVCHGELTREYVVAPLVTREVYHVNTIHLHAVCVGDPHRRGGSILHLRGVALPVDAVVVHAVRKPDIHLAGRVGIDVVRAVAIHHQINLRVRRKALMRHLEHLAAGTVHRVDIAPLALVEILIFTVSARMHAAA